MAEPLLLGWPVPHRGGVLYTDYVIIAKMRNDDRIRRYLISTYPINRVLQDANDDADQPPKR